MWNITAESWRFTLQLFLLDGSHQGDQGAAICDMQVLIERERFVQPKERKVKGGSHWYLQLLSV